MARTVIARPGWVAELLKVARSRYLSADDLADAMDVSPGTARVWAEEFLANGVFLTRPASTGRRGPQIATYALSPEWGGCAP